jgi:hypothetical protein
MIWRGTCFVALSSGVREQMAKKTKRTRASKSTRKNSQSSGKRDLIRRRTGSAYAKRTAAGRFNEMDDIGRSQGTDKPRKAKRRVRSGYGDQGDMKARAGKR